MRTQSERSSSSTPVEVRGVQMRRPSQNSTDGSTSPLNMPDFRNKHLSRVFEWEPTHLGSISGSSDSLDSAEVAEDRTSSGTGFSAECRLPPGFETGLFDRSFGFRPSLFSSISQSLSDPHVSRLALQSDTGRGSSGTGKVSAVSGESGSTSRVVPIKVITNQSPTGSKVANMGSVSSRGSSVTTADGHVKAAVVKSNSSGVVERECQLAPVSKHRTLPLSKRSSRSVQLPAGFLTELGPISIPNTSGTKHTVHVDRLSRGNNQNVKIVSVSDMDDERKVRVIPISHEQNAEDCEAPTRKQRGTRGRVIPVVVQSSNLANANDTRNSTDPTSSQRSESGTVSIPVTVVQSDSGAASKSSAMTDRNYLSLCYDDEAEETVKNILREMTVKRLPIRDTVRLLNTKTPRSRSMDFLDSKRHAVCEESPSSESRHTSIKRKTSVTSPTIELLPPGFMVGNSSGNEPPQGLQNAVPPVTSDLIRRRLHQFDGVDANSS